MRLLGSQRRHEKMHVQEHVFDRGFYMHALLLFDDGRLSIRGLRCARNSGIVWAKSLGMSHDH